MLGLLFHEIRRLLAGADIDERMASIDSDLAGLLSTAVYLLNMSEAMTSQAEVDSQRVTTSLSQLRDELTILRRNVSRVSDVTHDTRSRAHNLEVSTEYSYTVGRAIVTVSVM